MKYAGQADHGRARRLSRCSTILVLILAYDQNSAFRISGEARWGSHLITLISGDFRGVQEFGPALFMCLSGSTGAQAQWCLNHFLSAFWVSTGPLLGLSSEHESMARGYRVDTVTYLCTTIVTIMRCLLHSRTFDLSGTLCVTAAVSHFVRSVTEKRGTEDYPA
jgi:hypothetical protein